MELHGTPVYTIRSVDIDLDVDINVDVDIDVDIDVEIDIDVDFYTTSPIQNEVQIGLIRPHLGIGVV